MTDVDIERADAVNAGLNREAFRKAWVAFQNTPIDLVADSDDETCKCLSNAIRTFIALTWKGAPNLAQDGERGATLDTARVTRISETLKKHIKLDWLNASDGHPDIVGFEAAAGALASQLLAPAQGFLTADQVRDSLRNRFLGASHEVIGKELGLSAGFVGMVLAGTREPSQAILERLGMESITLYRMKETA